MKPSIIAASCIALASFLVLPACSHSKVSITDRSDPYRDIDLTEPDFVIVQRFAVTPAQCREKANLGDVAGSDLNQNEKEARVGAQFAEALQREIVAELGRKKIKAHPQATAPRGSWKTAIVDGYFYQSTRLGFPLRKGQFDSRVVFNIQQVEIGDISLDVETKLTSNMMNAEIERVVDREAKMVAKEIVDKVIVPAYKRRGWKM